MELRYCSEALTNAIEVIIAVRPLSSEHNMVQSFRDRTANPRATVSDFLRGCQEAVTQVRLGYREADPKASAGNRLPTGFHFVAYKPEWDGWPVFYHY